jgi:hypothetical protein
MTRCMLFRGNQDKMCWGYNHPMSSVLSINGKTLAWESAARSLNPTEKAPISWGRDALLQFNYSKPQEKLLNF